MAENPYPHLGWNPVPGIPGEVQSLKTKVDSAAKALRSSHQQIQRLLGESDHWEGDAASAFHDALDGDLPEYMKNAARSLEKAVEELHNWDGHLGSNRNLAEKYDKEAKEKKEAAGTAEEHHKAAGKDPDLKLGGKEYPNEAEAEAATARLRAAEDRLKDAAGSVEKANDAYNHVIKKAKELEKEHTADANKVANKLEEADDKLAPKEPGWFGKTLEAIGDALATAGEWLLEHAGTIGAIAGLLALFPTPLTPLFAGIAIVASGASMAKNFSSEDFRDSLAGEYGGGEAFSAWASVIGDGLGMVPGAKALGTAGMEVADGLRVADDMGVAVSRTEKTTEFAKEFGTVFKDNARGSVDEAWSAAGESAKGSAKLMGDISANGLNVAANVESDLESADMVPDDGAAHNASEGVKGAVAAKTAAEEIKGLVSGASR